VRQDALPFEPCPSADSGWIGVCGRPPGQRGGKVAADRALGCVGRAGVRRSAWRAAGSTRRYASVRARSAVRLFRPSGARYHVIDGDTFEARVAVWPGIEIKTKVRLRGIDAPELHARCDDEWVRAQAARAALEKILAQGGVTIAQVGPDKYAGRIDAVVSTRNTADVSAALLSGGWARSYSGGWC
jgi:endonuclease YncB( thermonuclease family)